MLTLVIATAAFIGGNYAIICPWGTNQIGLGNYFQTTAILTLPAAVSNIGECRDLCWVNGQCTSFSWDDDVNSDGGDLCRLYNAHGATPRYEYNTGYFADQVLCANTRYQACPAGTQQIGSYGSYYATGQIGQYYDGGLVSIGQCQQACWRNANCNAFAYDPDSSFGSGNQELCRLYDVNSGIRRGQIPISHARADQVICGNTRYQTCPTGTGQIGGPGSYFQATPLADAFITLDQNVDIMQCQNWCWSHSDCTAYAWDFDAGSADGDQEWCQLFDADSSTPTAQATGVHSDRILCGNVRYGCPSGTTSQGDPGTFYTAGGIAYAFNSVYYDTPIECANLCRRYSSSSGNQCTAFSFDFDISSSSGNQELCQLYDADSQTSTDQYSASHRADTILCSVDGKFSAISPGIFSVDVISDGNDKIVQIPSYVVYCIVGLVFVNIICLMARCWRTAKSSKRKYKVVSMRSDEESQETDIDV